MRVKDIMTRDPACCTPATNLQEVARLMVEHDCGEIPVLENRQSMKPVGVVTDLLQKIFWPHSIVVTNQQVPQHLVWSVNFCNRSPFFDSGSAEVCIRILSPRFSCVSSPKPRAQTRNSVAGHFAPSESISLGHSSNEFQYWRQPSRELKVLVSSSVITSMRPSIHSATTLSAPDSFST